MGQGGVALGEHLILGGPREGEEQDLMIFMRLEDGGVQDSRKTAIMS